MIEQDYVDFCNEVYGLTSRAEGYLAKLSEEDLRQMQGLVRSEMGASSGAVAPGYNFLMAMLDAEIVDRETHPSREFRDAMIAYVSATVQARDDLATDLAKLPGPEWHRARNALTNWIDRGCTKAPAYRRVVEIVDCERSNAGEAQAQPLEVPF